MTRPRKYEVKLFTIERDWGPDSKPTPYKEPLTVPGPGVDKALEETRAMVQEMGYVIRSLSMGVDGCVYVVGFQPDPTKKQRAPARQSRWPSRRNDN